MQVADAYRYKACGGLGAVASIQRLNEQQNQCLSEI